MMIKVNLETSGFGYFHTPKPVHLISGVLICQSAPHVTSVYDHESESCTGSCSTQGNGGYTRNRGGNVEHQVGYNRTPTHFLI